MTIKQFIECAIEGGWKYKRKHQEIYLCEDQPKEGEGDTRIGLRSNTYAIMLDPNAWRAVGKVKGWKGDLIRMCNGCGVALRVNEEPTMDGKHGGKNGCGSDIIEYDGQWLIEMHRMIDALCDGKTIEEFIATQN